MCRKFLSFVVYGQTKLVTIKLQPAGRPEQDNGIHALNAADRFKSTVLQHLLFICACCVCEISLKLLLAYIPVPESRYVESDYSSMLNYVRCTLNLCTLLTK